jgi:hypothetical protein
MNHVYSAGTQRSLFRRKPRRGPPEHRPPQESRDDKGSAKPCAARFSARRPALTAELRILRSGGIRTRDLVVLSDVVPPGIRHAPVKTAGRTRGCETTRLPANGRAICFPEPPSRPQCSPAGIPPGFILPYYNLAAATRSAETFPLCPLSYGSILADPAGFEPATWSLAMM